MTEPEQRASVVAEARSWIGTPWHHQADIKGAGIDCAMLLVRAFVDTGIITPLDPRPYPREWMFHQDGERFLGWVLSTGAVEITGEPQPGDVVLWRVGRSLSHGGIVSDWPNVIHAYARARQVQEDDISRPGLASDPAHPRRFFSHWGGT